MLIMISDYCTCIISDAEKYGFWCWPNFHNYETKGDGYVNRFAIYIFPISTIQRKDAIDCEKAWIIIPDKGEHMQSRIENYIKCESKDSADFNADDYIDAFDFINGNLDQLSNAETQNKTTVW